MFTSTVLLDNGTSCVIVGNGDPNANSVVLSGSCTEGIYFDTSARDNSPVWLWLGSEWGNS